MEPIVESGTLRLRDLTSLVREELDWMNGQLVDELRPDEPDLVPLIEHALHYRGKQLRPALTFLGARAVSDDASSPALGPRLRALATVATTVEFLHTASLVHDDVLDGATLRRKISTVNALHGTEIPVLLGDYIYAKAFALAVSLDDPTCGRVLGEVVRRMCQGEITQILHRFDFDWDEARYERVIHDKTATLYAAAARLGAHYGGGDPDQADALDRFGRSFGIAFQIVDDCLDLVGDEEVVGKSLGTDLHRGKLTLPLLWLMRDEHREARLRELMAGPGAKEESGDEKLARLRAEFPVADAIRYSAGVARRHVESALEDLGALPESLAREQLAGLCHYVLSRKL